MKRLVVVAGVTVAASLVLSVSGATPESVGVSSGSQRDEAIGDDGRPWLMLAGTPGAHIMIPINR